MCKYAQNVIIDRQFDVCYNKSRFYVTRVLLLEKGVTPFCCIDQSIKED